MYKIAVDGVGGGRFSKSFMHSSILQFLEIFPIILQHKEYLLFSLVTLRLHNESSYVHKTVRFTILECH